MTTNYANKGMTFEKFLEATHAQYKRLGIGIVEKMHTPFTLVRKYNQAKKRSEVVNAFPSKKSTVDFIGQVNGIPIAIEAKETSNKASFYIPSIQEHQDEFLRCWHNIGGLSFVIVHFVVLQEVFLLPYGLIENWQIDHKRKSIPITYIRNNAHKIEPTINGIPLHYAKFIT